MNATDGFFIPIGIKWKEAIKTGQMLAKIGFDAIEVSCGCYESGMTMIRGPVPLKLATQTFKELAELPGPVKFIAGLTEPLSGWVFPFRENYNIKYASELRKLVDVPILSVGGIRDPHKMEQMIKNGSADMLSMARPILCEPNFPKRIAEGDLSPSKCVNCNICLMHLQVKGLKCYMGKTPKPENYYS